jgi:tetratricopeptide (TPR) repeat protein
LPEVPEQNISAERPSRLRFYLRQRPLMLILLTVFAVVFFLLVTGLSRLYVGQQRALGNRWYERGLADLKARRHEAAVSDFRAALLYSRDNYTYQLSLAEALLGMRHTAEAYSYLLNLWDRQPEDGLVNLELARIAAQRGQTEQAVRYYHDAVYAVWPAKGEIQRREARLELIDLLLGSNAKAQAQAELIARAENETENPAEQQLLGDLFVRAEDYKHALTEYELSLKADPHNPRAPAGAGYAAYELGRYPLAQRYLQEAVKLNPSDMHSAELLGTTEMVLHKDPYRRGISTLERNRLIIEAFTTAGQRLDKCTVPSGEAGNSGNSPEDLSSQWLSLKPQITQRVLQKNPDVAEQAMNVVFRIERETSKTCGVPTSADLALILISRLHEGNTF